MLDCLLILYGLITMTRAPMEITYVKGDVACKTKVRGQRQSTCPIRLRQVLKRKCIMKGFNGSKTALLGGKRHPCVRRGRFRQTLAFTKSIIIVRLNVGSASPHS